MINLYATIIIFEYPSGQMYLKAYIITCICIVPGAIKLCVMYAYAYVHRGTCSCISCRMLHIRILFNINSPLRLHVMNFGAIVQRMGVLK